MSRHFQNMAAPVLSSLAMLIVTAPSRAQDAAPASRAEVKAETRQAQKEHRLVPAGEGSTPPNAKPAPRSSKTRAQRKAETVAARNAGLIAPTGEANTLKTDRQARSTTSTKTRAQRKAETRAAAKANELIPAGEGSGTPKK